MFRIVAPVSAIMTLAITNLVPVHAAIAIAVMAGLMVSNSGRMVAAMAMITSSVAPHRRGGFLSANASVQHLAIGFGSYIGGLIIAEAADGRLLHFPILGLLSAAATIACLWLAGRIQPITGEHDIPAGEAIVTAAEAMYDGLEPVTCESSASAGTEAVAGKLCRESA